MQQKESSLPQHDYYGNIYGCLYMSKCAYTQCTCVCVYVSRDPQTHPTAPPTLLNRRSKSVVVSLAVVIGWGAPLPAHTVRTRRHRRGRAGRWGVTLLLCYSRQVPLSPHLWEAYVRTLGIACLRYGGRPSPKTYSEAASCSLGFFNRRCFVVSCSRY